MSIGGWLWKEARCPSPKLGGGAMFCLVEAVIASIAQRDSR